MSQETSEISATDLCQQEGRTQDYFQMEINFSPKFDYLQLNDYLLSLPASDITWKSLLLYSVAFLTPLFGHSENH